MLVLNVGGQSVITESAATPLLRWSVDRGRASAELDSDVSWRVHRKDSRRKCQIIQMEATRGLVVAVVGPLWSSHAFPHDDVCSESPRTVGTGTSQSVSILSWPWKLQNGILLAARHVLAEERSSRRGARKRVVGRAEPHPVTSFPNVCGLR